jgi:hypothetical protein
MNFVIKLYEITENQGGGEEAAAQGEAAIPQTDHGGVSVYEPQR